MVFQDLPSACQHQLDFLCAVCCSHTKLLAVVHKHHSLSQLPQHVTAPGPAFPSTWQGTVVFKLRILPIGVSSKVSLEVIPSVFVWGSLLYETIPSFQNLDLNFSKFKIKLCSLNKTRERKIEINCNFNTCLSYLIYLPTFYLSIHLIKCIYNIHINPQFWKMLNTIILYMLLEAHSCL